MNICQRCGSPKLDHIDYGRGQLSCPTTTPAEYTALKIKTERSGSVYRVTVEAPYGFVWSAGKVHELVAEGRGSNSREALKDVRERMAYGLTKCQVPNCDWCHDDSIK